MQAISVFNNWLQRPDPVLSQLNSASECICLQRLPCFTLANLREKIKEGQYPHPHTHPHKRQYHLRAQTPPMVSDQKPLPRRMRQVHNTAKLAPTCDLEKLQLPVSGCRKHPHGPEPNTLFNNDLERRFYFEKSGATNKCNLHSKNLAKSLNELYAENALSPANNVQPPTMQQQQQQQQQRQGELQFSDLPQEFPLTRSISTTSELFAHGIYGNGNGNGNGNAPTTTTAAAVAANSLNIVGNKRQQHQSSSVAETEDQYVVDQYDRLEEDEEGASAVSAQRLCGLKRGSRRTKDELFQDFCKRAGVRPKPKNIYYVSSEQEQAAAAAAFQTLSEVDEQQFYASEDNHNFLLNSTRRASMCVEPTHASNNKLVNCTPRHAGTFGGSQTHLPQDVVYQSRTLPRSFLKQRTHSESQESVFGSSSLHASSLALHQQQQPRPTHFFTPAAAAAAANYHKSCENVAQTLKIAYPAAVQWPAAIPATPASPANFTNKLQLYATPTNLLTPTQLTHALLTRSMSSGTAAGAGATPKIQRAYAFDEQRRNTTSLQGGDAFDLDEMERERRRSHASLLGAGAGTDYDLINGTAV